MCVKFLYQFYLLVFLAISIHYHIYIIKIPYIFMPCDEVYFLFVVSFL